MRDESDNSESTEEQSLSSPCGPVRVNHYYYFGDPVAAKGGAGGGHKGGGVVPGGGTIDQTGKLPGRMLKHCESQRVWRNLGAAADHTAEVNPAQPPNGFPPGSKVTLFVAPDNYTGGVPQNPSAGPAELNPQGEAVSLPVKTNEAIFVHYDKGKTNDASIRALITQN
jgi:hypothetical protein